MKWQEFAGKRYSDMKKSGSFTASEVYNYTATITEDGCNGISLNPITITSETGQKAVLQIYAGTGAMYYAVGMWDSQGNQRFSSGLTSAEAAMILQDWLGTGEREITGMHPRARGLTFP